MEQVDVLTAETDLDQSKDDNVSEDDEVLTADVGHGVNQELSLHDNDLFDEDDLFTDEDAMATVSESKITSILIPYNRSPSIIVQF